VNKIGIYYAYWCKDWDADFFYYASKVSKLGFEVFEVNTDAIMNMSDTARQNLKDLVKKENLEMTFCMGLANKYDISVADESIRRRGIEYLKRIIERSCPVFFMVPGILFYLKEILIKLLSPNAVLKV